MGLPQPGDMTLTLGDLCVALAEGALPSRKDDDYHVVRMLDVRRLQRRESAQMPPLDRWLEAVRSDTGIFA
jgi:hypothetical protein